MSEFYIEAKSLQRDSRIVRRGCCSLRTIRTPQLLSSAPPVSPFLVIFGHLWGHLWSILKILTFKYEDSKVEMIQDDSAVQAVQDSPGNTPRLEGTEHQLH
jgi:hypothetical protein